MTKKHTGTSDIDLTARGEEEARSLRDRIAKVQFTRILASPLIRAVKTAQLAGYKAEILPELREWDYGQYNGLTTEEIHGENPEWNVFQHGAPGGESPAAVSERADVVVRRLLEMSGNIAVFSHGHFLRVVAARWLGLPVQAGNHLILSTASVSILSFEHKNMAEPAIELWNSCGVLG